MKSFTPLQRRTGVGLALAASILLSPTVRAEGDGEHHQSQIKRGFEIVPAGVSLNLAGKNRALVGLGSYIVNSGGCNDCHTRPSYAPGGNPFKGEPEMVNAAQYLSGGGIFGPFVSANLTPDYAGRPAGLTLEGFFEVMRKGHNPKDPPGVIVQVMPWPVFGKKTDHDLKAVYEYLRSIPSLPDNPHPQP
jgi:hypothetical protein